MISLKKYLDQAENHPHEQGAEEPLPAALGAYRSALQQIGECGSELCSPPGEKLRRALVHCCHSLPACPSVEQIHTAKDEVGEHLRDFSRGASQHFQQQTADVKEMLLVMARSAEAVGERDQRCTRQIQEITTRLQHAAKLEDLTQIRASIVRGAAELKSSIDKMAAEGKAAVEQLRREISCYQSKLEEAEQVATRDALTQLRSRAWLEAQIERRIAARMPFCVALIDLDGFKMVNDDHGHMVGDELLKQFATELKAACRSSDLIGRWGGDEFLILLDCSLAEASAQTKRLRQWVCGDYLIQMPDGLRKLKVSASIGVAEHVLGESIRHLLSRADEEMYCDKKEQKDHLLAAAAALQFTRPGGDVPSLSK